MSKNSGKIFEDQFKKSVPDYCLLQRLNDPPQAFSQSELTRFARENPCDFFMFDDKARLLYCLELKTTKNKSISFEDIDSGKEQKRMIHKHQIEGLTEFARRKNVIAGFLLNFRNEEKGLERTYFLDIRSFNEMRKKIGKHSFNEIDLVLNNAVKIQGVKKRVHYTWDIDEFLKLRH